VDSFTPQPNYKVIRELETGTLLVILIVLGTFV